MNRGRLKYWKAYFRNCNSSCRRITLNKLGRYFFFRFINIPYNERKVKFMKTNHDRLLTDNGKIEIQKAIIFKNYSYVKDYFYAKRPFYLLSPTTLMKQHGDISDFSMKYVTSVDRIVKKMENDKDFAKKVDDLKIRYEEELQRIVNRWKAKNFKRVMNEELKKIEAGV